jgi:predicted RNA-binding protein with PIN domain
LRSEVAEAQTATATAAAVAEKAELEAADLRATLADLVAERDQHEATAAAPSAPGAEAAAALAGAAAAASQLGAALTAASEALGFPVFEEPTREPAQAPLTAPAPVPARQPSRSPVRRPTPLPPATFEDSLEAADYLVRVSGMVLLVDGYNVSLRAWPDLATRTQRRRLTDALTELAARTGVDARVVFDGAEQPEPGTHNLPVRSPVRVYFSPPDVDADEVLIELVEQLPANRPVLVATSDRRVQGEVRRRGANVISSQRLLDLLGRAREGRS